MQKEEVLEKLKILLNSEKEGENEYYPLHLQSVDDSEIPQDKKKHCKDIIEKLVKDCAIHAKILEELEKTVIRSKKYDF